MSIAALKWCRAVRVSPTQKLILYVLADMANEDGFAWPSIATLCEVSGLGERAVQGAVKELAAGGLVEVDREARKTSTYLLNLSASLTTHPRSRCAHPAGDAPTPQEIRPAPQQVRAAPAAGAPEATKKPMKLSAPRALPPEARRQERLPMLPTSEPGPRAELFSAGLISLMRISGKREGAARSLLGRLLRAASDDHKAVLDVLRRAEELRPADPVPWLMAAVRATPRGHALAPKPVPEEVDGWLVRPVVARVLEELDIGDLRFPDLPAVVVALLAEKYPPASLYSAARQIARRGVETMEGAGYLASLVRRRARDHGDNGRWN